MQKKGNKYGVHRVIEPKGLLTQAAGRIDNTMECWSNEILCDVSALNIDSASFTQIYEACGGDLDKTGQMILDIVAQRGKMQNPVTGSGGMFIGTVREIGEDLADKIDLRVGDRIASLVSLSLTPLKINRIKAIHPEIDRVLMLTTDQCSMYCRHCTRRRFAGQHDTSVPVEQIDQCIAYIHPGDPCRPGCPSLRRRRADALRRDAGVHHLPPAGDPPCGDHPTGLPHAGGVPPAYHPQTVRHAQEVPPRVAQHPLQPSKGDHQGGRRGLRPSGRRRCASGQPVRAARRCERLRPHHEEAGPNAGPDPGTALLRTTPRCRCPLPCR
mgnify:CR=1 FL=1